MNPHELKAALPRTWAPFFLRHSNFTAAQLAAIPPLLAGHNLLLTAPTAGGKTEAALAPLIERHLPADRPDRRLTILYLLPTKALVSNLWSRLAPPLEALRVALAVKTHDLNTFDPRRPAELLLTTPESLDALLAGQARVLSGLRAVVVDELHIFDGTVRGDQLRVLLNRLRQIRTHALQAAAGEASAIQLQFAALSATLRQPERAAARYFADAHVVAMPGGRAVNAEVMPIAADSPTALLEYLATFRGRGWRKALVFCNTRAEVESYATALRTAGSPFGDAVYVHYSNLEPQRRAEIERLFSQSQVAICFASSTLELGIDIGDIDIAILIGAPGSSAAFAQRLGRASRRQRTVRVACFYRTSLERHTFAALLAGADLPAPHGAFHLSVAVQQIFSLLKQSPSGAVRLNPLAELFAGMLTPDHVRAILGHLQLLGYLKSGRPGEWRAGEKLNQLADLQAGDRATLSLHSNIESAGGPQVQIRDQMTHRVLASVDRQWFDRDLLTLEGRPLNMHWYDGEALWVSPYHGPDTAEQLRYISTRQLLSYELAQELPGQFGLERTTAPLLPQEDGLLLFHWLGDIYGRALCELINYTLPADETAQQGLCLLLHEEAAFPLPTPAQVQQYLHDHYHRYEPLLALGAYHYLLPVELRRSAVVEQFDIPRFVAAVTALHIERTPQALAQDLLDLLP